jgi:hypothetical protein
MSGLSGNPNAAFGLPNTRRRFDAVRAPANSSLLAPAARVEQSNRLHTPQTCTPCTRSSWLRNIRRLQTNAASSGAARARAGTIHAVSLATGSVVHMGSASRSASVNSWEPRRSVPSLDGPEEKRAYSRGFREGDRSVPASSSSHERNSTSGTGRVPKPDCCVQRACGARAHTQGRRDPERTYGQGNTYH